MLCKGSLLNQFIKKNLKIGHHCHVRLIHVCIDSKIFSCCVSLHPLHSGDPDVMSLCIYPVAGPAATNTVVVHVGNVLWRPIFIITLFVIVLWREFTVLKSPKARQIKSANRRVNLCAKGWSSTSIK
jgi:hypothetical protein